MFVSCFYPARAFAPFVFRPARSPKRPAFASAVRMVNRIHRRAADSGPHAHAPRPPGFSNDDKVVFFVGNLPDGGPCIVFYFSDFSRRKLQRRVSAIMRDDFRKRAGRPYQSRLALGGKRNIINQGARRKLPQRQAVAGQNRGFCGRQNFPPRADVSRQNHVSFFSVFIRHQADESCAVGIIFNRLNSARDVLFIKFKVNDSQKPLRSAALVASGNATETVPADIALSAEYQGFFGILARQKLPVIYSGHLSSSRASWRESFYHKIKIPLFCPRPLMSLRLF